MSLSGADIVWIDIETLGLNPEDQILEVALLYKGHQFTGTTYYHLPPREQRAAAGIAKVVVEMHRDSGLWEACENTPPNTSVLSLEVELLKWWHAARVPQRPLMGGSSVHADRMWLDRQMPTFASLFHYRNMDVSSIMEFFGLVPPSLSGKVAHRAAKDIHRTRDSYQWYQKRASLTHTPQRKLRKS